jgi:hypothetical protein
MPDVVTVDHGFGVGNVLRCVPKILSMEPSTLTSGVSSSSSRGSTTTPGWAGSRKEFWWECESRLGGLFHLPITYIVLCPASEQPEIRAWLHDMDPPPNVSYVDPAWSLEMIIGNLAGLPTEELGPF